MFSLEFSTLVCGLFGSAMLCAVLLSVLMIPRLRKVSRRVKADSASLADGDGVTDYPPVSVIVTADDDARNLAVLLPQLLGQDYPAAMEVIVVDNGEGSPTETVVARLQGDHPNLYLTYAPANSRNLSRKKLAVTIGVKAARYDCLLLTCGNCRVASPLWLRAMCRHFAAGKEIVAGYSRPLPADDAVGRPESRLAAFDRVRSVVEWVVPAMKGRVWRADGNNLGYTRRLFYENKGFQRSLNLKYGDDDIFVSEIATRSNCAVELSTDAVVDELEQDVARAHRLDRIRRDFTASMLPGASRRLWALMSWLWWGYIVCAVLTVLSALPSIVPLIAVTVVSVALALGSGFAWRSAMRSLASRPLCLTVAWFMTVHPIYTLVYKVRGRRARHSNFTWTTEK